ncbi:hypothetical protein CVIRNUC_010859 [Coccomyxa viridis]|uniref:Uncharacterized protein n=1 Tax=Coccomyxa viridis TaxID=1274662 RepID=A0AAV1IK32_9CHLO|nr:hypothetical protein CVIRNUC_010859 [Coccomyxa viridis]
MSHRRQAGPSQERPTLPSWRQLTLAGQEQEDAARQTLREEPSDASESTSTISDSSEDLRYIVRQPRIFSDAKRAAERPEDHRNLQGPIAQYNPGGFVWQEGGDRSTPVESPPDSAIIGASPSMTSLGSQQYEESGHVHRGMAVAVAEAANHRMNAASQQPGCAAPNLPCTPRLLPAAEYGDRRYTASGRFASLNKLSAPDSPPKDIGLGLVGGSKSLSGARNPYPRAARAAARAARASTRANACAQKQKQNDWETSGSERSWHEEGGNREDVAAAHQGTRARSGPEYSRTAGRGRGVSPAGRWLTIGARSKGHSRRPLAKSSGQADSRLKYGAARKRCPISSSGDARKASDVGSPGSTDMPEATHPSDEAAKAFRSFRRLRMASATGSPASSEMTQGSNLAGSRAPRAPEDVPMAKGLCSLGRPDIDKGLDSIPAVRVPEASQKAYLATDTSKPSIPEVPGSSVPHGNARGSEAMPPAMPFMKEEAIIPGPCTGGPDSRDARRHIALAQTDRRVQSRKQGHPRRARRLPSVSQPGPEGKGQLGSGLGPDELEAITQLAAKARINILTSRMGLTVGSCISLGPPDWQIKFFLGGLNACILQLYTHDALTVAACW